MQTETTQSKGSKNKSKKGSDLTPNEKIAKALKLVNEARDEKITASKESLNSAIEDGKETFENYRSMAKDRFNQSMQSAETRVTANPFKYMLGAGIVGLILGFLMSGRRK